MSQSAGPLPVVLYVFGFNPLSELHNALKKVSALENGYTLVEPNFAQPSQALNTGWTNRPLDHIIMPSDWCSRPLYLVPPHSIYIKPDIWRRIRMAIAEVYTKSICELSIESGARLRRPEKWVINEMTVYSVCTGTYL